MRLSWVDESGAEPLSTDMLEDVFDDSQSHPSINSREAWYKICDCNKRGHEECKGELLSTWNMCKGLHKVFRADVNEILQAWPILGKSGSEVFNCII